MTTEGLTAQPDLIQTELEGTALLANSMLNKGTAFTDEERDAFELHGLLPPRVATFDEQVSRRLQALRGSPPTSSATPSCATCRTPTRRCSTRC